MGGVGAIIGEWLGDGAFTAVASGGAGISWYFLFEASTWLAILAGTTTWITLYFCCRGDTGCGCRVGDDVPIGERFTVRTGDAGACCGCTMGTVGGYCELIGSVEYPIAAVVGLAGITPLDGIIITDCG